MLGGAQNSIVAAVHGSSKLLCEVSTHPEMGSIHVNNYYENTTLLQPLFNFRSPLEVRLTAALII